MNILAQGLLHKRLKIDLIYNNCKENTMEHFINMLQKVFIFEKEPQRIGLSQFKTIDTKDKDKGHPSLKNKNIKLSDLMRGETIK